MRRLVTSDNVNVIDGFGLTPLSWAVARGNDGAAETLLLAGANPWLAGKPREQNALFWAAAHGQQKWFERLVRMPWRPWKTWPSIYLNAALSGGNRQIVEFMLAEPHEPVRLQLLRPPLPPAALLELVVQDSAAADTLLEKAAREESGSLDFVRTALAKGADPNGGGTTRPHAPLETFATGINAESVEIVDLLLKAGADPNLAAHRTRPVWAAVRVLKMDGTVDEMDHRATAIVKMLVAAGRI